MLLEMQTVGTEVLSLEKIFEREYQFNIPSYQRPYVWPDADVLKLFSDINSARVTGERDYYIGTVLTSKRSDESGDPIYELIDGQQRTTTLMLMAIAFKMMGVSINLSGLAAFGSKPRLQFAIREQVQHLLGGLAGLPDYQVPGDEAIESDPYLTRMYAALTVLKQQIKKLTPESQLDLGEYIYCQVRWVNNVVPQQMDLNRLFSTMNTAGIQLEQSDILKSKLLRQIKSDKTAFEGIWVACEHLENYFERNVRTVFGGTDWEHIEPEHLADYDSKRFVQPHKDDSNEEQAGRTIAELYRNLIGGMSPASPTARSFEVEEPDEKTVYCRSIVSFPLLLIHAYRAYLAISGKADITPRLHSSRLLEIFEPLLTAPEDEVKAFFRVLWQVRYQFDRWVVKWVERDDANDEQLGLTSQSRSRSGNKMYINRSQKEVSELVLLQCVRNFTGEYSAQYWLTPLLAQLVVTQCQSEPQALELMERFDNQLSLAIDTQKIASFELAKGNTPELKPWSVQAAYFDETNGTGFEHYWFQKLEYLLWKHSDKDADKKLKRFRITSKNSVEHVHPQHEEYQQALADEHLNAFGNLVLLSPGENSSYSNQAVGKKQIDFNSKKQYDSLKLKEIFSLKEGDPWDKGKIMQHQLMMKDVLTQHYSK
ncbi:DUF262 domain-containing protein [Shewanella insulae]|uniref:DUF262 domain-containing protein n=1 Tax=Shewanella insulae TaxID=2681496 RepID=UPI002480E3F6|nr:DUF262 domain-containing HNH endonuclease family protein [Shewanella insulae]